MAIHQNALCTLDELPCFQRFFEIIDLFTLCLKLLVPSDGHLNGRGQVFLAKWLHQVGEGAGGARLLYQLLLIE